jgi:hypothetical protein
MDPDPATGPDTAGKLTAIATPVNQILLVVVGVALVLGLAYIVISVFALASDSRIYTFLAFLYVIAVVGGALAGLQADYDFVIRMVQTVGIAGATVMSFLGNVFSHSLAPPVSIGLSVLVAVVTFVPRVAVLGSAAVMLAGSLFVFEAIRREYLIGLAFVVSLAWMAGAALLLGNGVSEVLLPSAPPTAEPPGAQPR